MRPACAGGKLWLEGAGRKQLKGERDTVTKLACVQWQGVGGRGWHACNGKGWGAGAGMLEMAGASSGLIGEGCGQQGYSVAVEKIKDSWVIGRVNVQGYDAMRSHPLGQTKPFGPAQPVRRHGGANSDPCSANAADQRGQRLAEGNWQILW